MSVVAKFFAQQRPRVFPTTQQVDLSCVCDDRLFTINDPVPGRVSENQTFSQASPSGDCRIELPASEPIGDREEFYAIFIEAPECPTFDGALAVAKTYCSSVTDFGGISKQVDVSVCSRPYDYQSRTYLNDVHARQTWSFHMRMNIDNPAASIQFKPGGTPIYWMGLYRAKEFDLHEVLVDAHPKGEV